jgi:hypothetical protein
MIGMSDFKFGVYVCLSQSIEEICDKWKQILVFLSDLVESPVIDAQPERAVFFLGKKNWSSMTRTRRVYETRLLNSCQ